jgi:tetratricopeptide (TPR) repeat protein
MRYLILISLFVILINRDVYAQNDSIHILLQSIESLFNSGAYLNAELEGRRLLEHTVNDSVRAEIHKNIAFSLIAQGKTAQAKDQFTNLLKINPDYVLDPVYTSPKILAVFKESQDQFITSHKIKMEIAEKQEADNNKQVIGDAKITSEQLSYKYKAISYRTIIFPGWEQLYQDRNRAGSLFLGAGIAALGSGIVFEFLRSSARKDYLSETDPSKINDKYNTYNRYYKAETISLIAFAVVYVASEVDVLLAQHDLSLVINSNSIGSRGTELTFAISF